MVTYPPEELWSEKIYRLPELDYPGTLNACHELLDANLSSGRDKAPSIYAGEAVFTYGELARDVMSIAGALRDRGVQRGDCVVVRLLNRPHFIATFLAILRIGAIAVPTAPLLRRREIGAIVENCAPALLVSEPELWSEVERLEAASTRIVDVSLLRGLPVVECAPTRKDAPAVMLYTSGSTGMPKGCLHSHADLLAICDSYARHILEPSPRDRFGGHPTMAFAYGLGGLLLFPFRFGASAVLLDRFSPDAMVECIRRSEMTIAFCAPISLRMMMRQCRDLQPALASLRYVISAGETLPASVYRGWRDLTRIEALDGLGSTEMLHIFISSRPGRSRPGWTGEVVPGYDAVVVDEKTMTAVPDGEPGLLAVKGPTGCRYYGLPERQRSYVRNGWNIPGDLYVRDKDGFFQYRSRNDDLIICGGINIAAPEIENVLLEHPAVVEVAVVASPDDMHGMVPKAFIVLHDTRSRSDGLKKELQEFVRRELAPYKYPRIVEFIDELPKTSTGKIRRTELRGPI